MRDKQYLGSLEGSLNRQYVDADKIKAAAIEAMRAKCEAIARAYEDGQDKMVRASVIANAIAALKGAAGADENTSEHNGPNWDGAAWQQIVEVSKEIAFYPPATRTNYGRSKGALGGSRPAERAYVPWRSIERLRDLLAQLPIPPRDSER